MKAKEYLQLYENAEIRIEQKKEQVEELKAKALNIGGLVSDEERVQSSIKKDKIGAITSEYVDLEREIELDIKSAEQLKDEIIKAIHALQNQNHIRVLYLRYIKYKEYKTLKAVAKKMDYSYDYVREIHIDALREMDKKMTPECKAL